jgi:hypothetical protein
MGPGHRAAAQVANPGSCDLDTAAGWVRDESRSHAPTPGRAPMIHHLPLSVISNQDRILSAQELMSSDPTRVRQKSFPVRTRRRCQALESPASALFLSQTKRPVPIAGAAFRLFLMLFWSVCGVCFVLTSANTSEHHANLLYQSLL